MEVRPPTIAYPRSGGRINGLVSIPLFLGVNGRVTALAVVWRDEIDQHYLSSRVSGSEPLMDDGFFGARGGAI